MWRSGPFLFVVFLFVLGAGALAPAFLPRDGEVRLPVIGKVPEFSLLDSNSQPFTDKNLKNKISIFNFFFSSCPKVCPEQNAKVAELQRRFKRDSQVQFVSVSIDPERDTPDALSAYGKRFNADFSRWYFLTGDIKQTEKLLVDGFKLGTTDSPDLHTTRLVLVDYRGQARATSQLTDPVETREFVLNTVALSTELTQALRAARR